MILGFSLFSAPFNRREVTCKILCRFLSLRQAAATIEVLQPARQHHFHP
jgi:hypothetical protein